jgi:hypothetical protein
MKKAIRAAIPIALWTNALAQDIECDGRFLLQNPTPPNAKCWSASRGRSGQRLAPERVAEVRDTPSDDPQSALSPRVERAQRGTT